MLKKFIPKYHARSIYTIDYDKFYEDGVRLILLDLDNTLISYNDTLPTKELHTWKEEIINKGFELMIVSNSKKDRVVNFADEFGIPYVQFAKKPLKFGFKRALKKTSLVYKPAEVLEIGDQLLTDVLGSNRMGFKSVLVDAIDFDSEHLATRFNRFNERIVKFFLSKFYKEDFQATIIDYKGEK